jgi:class 3 adenylate cyclase
MANALKHYNRAIELAEAGNFTPLVGLANERAALLCLAHDQRRLAGWYLACARRVYAEKWGATAKVDWLDRKYGDLIKNAIPLASRETHQAASIPKSQLPRQGESFDVTAALQASRIIANEESGDRLLTHLMQVIRVQAGAEAAHMLVLEGNKLQLEASATIDSGGVVLFSGERSSAQQEPYSAAIVNFVLHTGQDLVIADADADARFAECDYVSNRRPKSVLCIPLRHHGEILGVIYIEHTAIAGTFTGQKVEWLHLLATEVGLTVWTARLSRYREYVHKFAPASVAKEIDANPVSPNLEARDRDVSILFGDLAGYTRMTEQMDRRQLDALMNRIFSRFIDEIHRYEGTLLEFRGDELFVLFEDEDPSRHVWKAVGAALAISRAAEAMKEELSGVQLPIVVNMGINSGIASVGLKAVDAASGSRWRYGASGTVVNVAARVRECARDGSILLSAEAAARVQSDFTLEDIGEHTLKNVIKPVRIYRLVASCRP